MSERILTVTAANAGQRLDLWCVAQVPELSRAKLQRAIRAGHITVNSRAVRPQTTVRAGDHIRLTLTEHAAAPAALVVPTIPIIYEDRDVVVVNKPVGVAMHPGQTVQPTVTAWFTERYPESRTVGDSPDRPGIVHRLDKGTSGVVVLAKTTEAHAVIKEQFKLRRVRKVYLALVYGVPGERAGRINRPLVRSARNPLRRTIDPMGREAITEWSRREVFGKRYALLSVTPLTGRMHQIRAHLHWLGFPIIGDPLYSFKRVVLPPGATARAGQFLHAAELTITLLSGRRRTFSAPLPIPFATVIETLRSKAP